MLNRVNNSQQQLISHTGFDAEDSKQPATNFIVIEREWFDPPLRLFACCYLAAVIYSLFTDSL